MLSFFSGTQRWNHLVKAGFEPTMYANQQAPAAVNPQKTARMTRKLDDLRKSLAELDLKLKEESGYQFECLAEAQEFEEETKTKIRAVVHTALGAWKVWITPLSDPLTICTGNHGRAQPQLRHRPSRYSSALDPVL